MGKSGGTGATGYAVVNATGGITRIVVTNRGQGYTSAPTVVIEAAAGTSGTGGSATAALANDVVASVSVGAAGTAYRSLLALAVDDLGQAVSSPILLGAGGERLAESDSAVWMERPLSGPLPYADLGLLS